MKTSELHLRDPFVLTDAPRKRYYLFGTDGSRRQGDRSDGFITYTSIDLDDWSGPTPAFIPPADFWADSDYWAPEVHEHHGKYYMFASFKAPARSRGTQILIATEAGGLYTPLSENPVTPPAWECLDGTLYVDDNNRPHMVFCHEWVQVGDGEICSLELTPDLVKPAGEARLLFKASANPLSRPLDPARNFGLVTDGPFVHRAAGGSLILLWATFTGSGYTQLQARSTSGKLDGPWEHSTKPLFDKDGGHAMLFRRFDGALMMSLHAPNSGARPVFLPVREKDGWLDVV